LIDPAKELAIGETSVSALYGGLFSAALARVPIEKCAAALNSSGSRIGDAQIIWMSV